MKQGVIFILLFIEASEHHAIDISQSRHDDFAGKQAALYIGILAIEIF